LAGSEPRDRVELATRALDRLGDAGRRGAVTLHPFQIDGQPANAVLIGDHVVFSVLQADAVPETLNAESERVRRRLEIALDVMRAQRQPRVLARGVAITVVGAAGALLLLLIVIRSTAWVETRLPAVLQRAGRSGRRWPVYMQPILLHLIRILRWLACILVLVAWVGLVLEAFPLTHPLGSAMVNFAFDSLRNFFRAVVEAAPGLATVLLLLLVTRALADGVSLLLDYVHSGRIRVPFVHPETAIATKRLVNTAVWGTGIALAYPHLPGADTQVFKGISVLFGIVLTLGTSGIVNQLMSGLVLIYSRALRRGDWVEVAGIEAEVVEVGGLATKLVNYNRHEITIPNSVMVGNSVRNYTKRAETDPIFLSVKVTIGYDAPWRLVHQMLLDAAAATPDLAPSPPAFILQRALGDFYVEYEVFAALEDPQTTLRRKPAILSIFNANVQDAFNSHNVQIMSPHYMLQPDSPVTVPKANWFSQVRQGE
jgi:small-conductance mechanosensitive channel